MRTIAPPKESYPLTWPDGWPRRKSQPLKHRDDWKYPVTVGQGCEMLMTELRRLNVPEVVISSNLRTRLDGQPYSNQAQPADPAIAIYFTLKGRPTVLACDRWDKVGRNLWAITRHIEALRAMDRYGVGSMEQAFAGYAQLPAPGQTSGLQWWTELGVAINADGATIKEAYLRLVKQRHPDRGGKHEDFVRLNEAYRMAMDQQGRAPA